jgi:RimJ/RimL family protein N-acetyltransferase
MKPVELRGNGLLLAAPTSDDVDRITECCQDPEIARWISNLPSPYRRADAESYVHDLVPSGWADGSALNWAIRDLDGDRLLGMIGLRPQHDLATVGFWLSRDARGQKVVSRAVRLVAEYAFDDKDNGGLDLTYLQWYALKGNWASRRVAWATGFQWDATVRAWHPGRTDRSDAWFATLKAGEPMEPNKPWLDVPVITGDNVVLRPLVESDADALVEICNDPVSQYWLSSLPSPYTLEEAHKFITLSREMAATGAGVFWGLARPEGGPAIGSFSLMGLDRRSGGGEIGYGIHPDVRGKGFTTEAVGLMLCHAFASKADGGLELRRVVVAHVDGNDGSRKPIERNGFKLIGTERAEHQFRDGSIADLVWYDLLSDESTGR